MHPLTIGGQYAVILPFSNALVHYIRASLVFPIIMALRRLIIDSLFVWKGLGRVARQGGCQIHDNMVEQVL